MRPDPAARDARDANRATALRALQERDEARRERDQWQLASDLTGSELADALTTLRAIDELHQPDGHACTCGATWPCKTRRELDR